MRRIDWYAVAAVFFLLSTYVAAGAGLPDVWVLVLGVSALTSAVLSLRR